MPQQSPRSPLQRALSRWQHVTNALDAAQPLAALVARIYVANAFFLSGLTKLRDWGTTVSLFTDEYHVPLLPPELAAVMGTTGELVLPVLLVLGLAGRFAALGLSVVNVVAVIRGCTCRAATTHYLGRAAGRFGIVWLWKMGTGSLVGTSMEACFTKLVVVQMVRGFELSLSMAHATTALPTQA